MSNVTGTISVNVEFQDKTTSTGVQSLKTVTLREANEYTTGKVAILSGTANNTPSTLWSITDGLGFGGYKNASGTAVVFSSVTRVAVQSSGLAVTTLDVDSNSFVMLTNANRIGISENTGSVIEISANGGTATFTAILYGT